MLSPRPQHRQEDARRLELLLPVATLRSDPHIQLPRQMALPALHPCCTSPSTEPNSCCIAIRCQGVPHPNTGPAACSTGVSTGIRMSCARAPAPPAQNHYFSFLPVVPESAGAACGAGLLPSKQHPPATAPSDPLHIRYLCSIYIPPAAPHPRRCRVQMQCAGCAGRGVRGMPCCHGSGGGVLRAKPMLTGGRLHANRFFLPSAPEPRLVAS